MPAPPDWVAELPLRRRRASLQLWEQIAASGVEGLLSQLAPYAGAVTRRIVAQAGDFGFILLEFVLALAFAALLYLRGEEAARMVQRIGARLAGPRRARMRSGSRRGRSAAWRSASAARRSSRAC